MAPKRKKATAAGKNAYKKQKVEETKRTEIPKYVPGDTAHRPNKEVIDFLQSEELEKIVSLTVKDYFE
jgi:hypothetical protein